MNFSFCTNGLRRAFDLGKAREVTAEITSHKPSGSDWFLIEKSDFIGSRIGIWHLTDTFAGESPWAMAFDHWLTRHFGSKPVYAVIWLDADA